MGMKCMFERENTGNGAVQVSGDRHPTPQVLHHYTTTLRPPPHSVLVRY